MKKNLFSLLSILFVAALCVGFASCGGDDDGDVSNPVSNNNSNNFNKILGTWKMDHHYEYNLDGSLIQDYPSSLGDSYFTFTSTNYEGDKTKYLCINDYISEFLGTSSYRCFWTFSNNCISGNAINGEIVSLDNNQLNLKKMFDNGTGYSIERLVRASEPTHNFSSNSGNSGNENPSGGNGGTSSEDAPYVTSFDYTATKNSITVKFMCSERPTSATIKYGEVSPTNTISPTISGKQVSATATGLKSGTKYYFNITVRNSYGSTESKMWSAMTNY